MNYPELQYGEVPWRADVLTPPERFVDGRIRVPDTSGLGVRLNDAIIGERGLPL